MYLSIKSALAAAVSFGSATMLYTEVHFFQLEESILHYKKELKKYHVFIAVVKFNNLESNPKLIGYLYKTIVCLFTNELLRYYIL